MEKTIVVLDVDHQGTFFDHVLHSGALPEGGDLQIVTKSDGTKSGLPCVMFTFTVQLPDGSMQRAQAVTSLKLLNGSMAIINAHHGDARFKAQSEVTAWAQAMLTALNVGDVQRESPLHKKLREVMIAFREAQGGT